jgi:hypothetical protein
MFDCSKCRRWWIIFMGIVISFRDGREGRMMLEVSMKVDGGLPRLAAEPV